MSVLAVITVVQCDDCERTEVLETGPEYRTYERTWLVTPETQLCFLCREKKEAIDNRALARVVSRINRKYGAAEVTHG